MPSGAGVPVYRWAREHGGEEPDGVVGYPEGRGGLLGGLRQNRHPGRCVVLPDGLLWNGAHELLWKCVVAQPRKGGSGDVRTGPFGQSFGKAPRCPIRGRSPLHSERLLAPGHRDAGADVCWCGGGAVLRWPPPLPLSRTSPPPFLVSGAGWCPVLAGGSGSHQRAAGRPQL